MAVVPSARACARALILSFLAAGAAAGGLAAQLTVPGELPDDFFADADLPPRWSCRQPGERGGGRTGQPQRLLPRGRVGGRLQERGWRAHLAPNLRRPAGAVDRRAGDRTLRRQRGVGGDRRVVHPLQRLHRQRRVPLHRRGPHLAAHGARGDGKDRAHRHPSRRPGTRVRRGGGPPLRPAAGARALPHHRRRGELGAGALLRRELGRDRRGDGSHQPAHPLRRDLADADLDLGARERRPGKRALDQPRRGRQLDPAGGRRAAPGHHGPDRPRHDRGGSGPGLRAHRNQLQPGVRGAGGARGHAVAVRRRGALLDDGQRRSRAGAAAPLLLAHGGRARRRRRGALHVHRAHALAGRRCFLRGHLGRRQPRHVDRSARPGAHDHRQRPGSAHLHQPGAQLVPSAPAHRPDVPRPHRHPGALQPVRQPPGRALHRRALQHAHGGRDPGGGVEVRGRLRDRVRHPRHGDQRRHLVGVLRGHP